MKSLLVLSIVLAFIAVPAWMARDPNPRRGLWRMLVVLSIVSAIYVVYVSRVHPVLFVPRWR
ncbi:MAG TPA: hypothetical protein VLT61_16230 [Anaeromyxobacteraceae bacterium]|nr:hypothetical protein [Anaeromyxobacteraceae bacterium]